MYILKPYIFKNYPEIIFGFSTKISSDAKPPYYFNLSYSVGDEKSIVDKNRKDYTTSGGVYIRLGYESATGKWVQLVTSSDRPSPFIDTFSKNSYYYPNQWVEGGITIFEDWPLRPWDVSWRADLLFEEQGEVIIHLNYGFDIKGGKTNIIPFRSFKPVPFEYFMQGYPY